MKPDRTNYEIWLIDYLDGTLDSDRQRELSLFLDENPDIGEEFSEMMIYRIPVSDVEFINKGALKKGAENLSPQQFETLCVADAENDLSDSQIYELNKIINADPEKRIVAESIRRIKLVPPAVEFRYKSRLKKLTSTQKIFRITAVTISSAAALLMLFSILRNPQASVPEDNPQLAKQDRGNFSEPSSSSMIIQPLSVTENNNTEIADKGEQSVSVIYGDIRISVVQDSVEAVTSSSFDKGPTLSKIDYRNLVAFNNTEFNPPLISININPAYGYAYNDGQGLKVSIEKFFREKILKSESPDDGPLKAYEIADAGINGLNRLFGWEMSLKKNTNEKGEVNSVYFNSRLIKFNAPVKRSEPSE